MSRGFFNDLQVFVVLFLLRFETRRKTYWTKALFNTTCLAIKENPALRCFLLKTYTVKKHYRVKPHARPYNGIDFKVPLRYDYANVLVKRTVSIRFVKVFIFSFNSQCAAVEQNITFLVNKSARVQLWKTCSVVNAIFVG